MSRIERIFLGGACCVLGLVVWVIFRVIAPAEDSETITQSGNRQIEIAGDGARRTSGPAVSRPTTEATQSRPQDHVQEPVQVGDRSLSGRVVFTDDQPAVGAKIAAKLYYPDGMVSYGLVEEFTGESVVQEDGTFRLGLEGDGLYRVTISHPLAAPFVKDRVSAGEALDVRLEPGGRLRGHVVAKVGGRGIPGARIEFRRSGVDWTARTESDADGRFELDGVFTGQVLVNVFATDWLDLLDRSVHVDIGEDTEVLLELEPGKEIEGLVRDSEDRPIARAEVKVGRKSALSGDDGAFRVTALPADSLWIVASADGYLPHSAPVNLSGSRDRAVLDIKLAKGGVIQGLVIDDAGKPVPGATVKVFEGNDPNSMWESGDAERNTRQTDDEGRFVLEGLQAQSWSSYRVRARLAGFADAFSSKVSLTNADKPAEVTIILSPGGRISGRVYGRDNLPVAGVKITCSPESVYEWSAEARKFKHPTVLTDAEGRYEFQTLGEQVWRITAFCKGYATFYRGGLKIVATTHLENIDLLLTPAETLRGRVVDENQKPLAGARIDASTQKSWGQAVSDENGEYVLTSLSEGPYNLGCRLDGYSLERKRNVYPEGGRIDFELRRDGFIEGRVVSAIDQVPIRVFEVELQRQNGQNYQTVVQRGFRDIDGRFKIYAKDGTYRLRVSARGYKPNETYNLTVALTSNLEPITVEMTLGGSIEGWFTNNVDRPISGVQVFVRETNDNSASPWRLTSNSESDGYFFVSSLVEGLYDLAFYASERQSLIVEERISVRGGELTTVRTRARDPSTVHLSFYIEDNSPLRRFRATIENLNGGGVAIEIRDWRSEGARGQVVTSLGVNIGSDGYRRITHLPPGSYRVKIQRSDYDAFDQDFTVAEGRETSVQIPLYRRGQKPKTAPQPTR